MSGQAAVTQKSLAQALQIDGLCDRFEVAISAGQDLRIDELLSQVSADRRPFLLRELLAVAVEHHRETKSTIDYGEFMRQIAFAGFATECEKELIAVLEDEQRGRTFALDTVVKQIADTGIVTPARLRECLPPKAYPKNPEELIQELVVRQDLTEYQAIMIVAGKAQALILGNYTILDTVGSGGMGQVFKAEHRRMERIVAIKTLPAPAMQDPEAVIRFQREAKAAAKLRHPNIVAADDADEAGGVHFLVMEYVEGLDFSALVKQHGPQPPERALSYILQAARGLEYAHKRGVIHRDIKPGNLLLSSEGTVKILDMGLARLEGHTAQPGLSAEDLTDRARISGTGESAEISPDRIQDDLTHTGSIMGTIDYMSPEQATDTKLADKRADIYSLGCTLYYVLAGKPMYTGETPQERIAAHREQMPPPLPSISGDSSEHVAAIYKKMVAKRVEERYQTMSEVAADLERCLVLLRSKASGTNGMRAEPLETTELSPSRTLPSRTYWLAAAALGSAILAATMAFPRKSPTANTVVKLDRPAKSAAPLGENLSPPLDRTDNGENGEATGTAAVGTAAVGTAVEQIDADRRAAEWVLSLEGSVRCNSLTSPLIRAVADLPHEHFSLAYVSISREISDESLATYLGSLTELQYLSIISGGVTDKSVPLLVKMTKLKSLKIWDTAVTDAGGQALRAALPRCAVYWAIDQALAAAVLGSGGIVSVEGRGEPVSDPRELPAGVAFKLTAINLSGADWNDAKMQANSMTWPNTSEVKLDGTPITDASLATIRKQKSKKLRLLSLKGTKVTADGVASLQQTLPLCRIEWDGGVIEPAVRRNAISLPADSSTAADEDLERRAALWIFFCGGHVRIKGMAESAADLFLAAELPKDQFLLSAVTTPSRRVVTEDEFVEFLGPLSDLSFVNCTNTTLTDAVVPVLVNMPSLRTLHIWHNQLTDAGGIALQAGLPQCKVYWTYDQYLADKVLTAGGTLRLDGHSEEIHSPQQLPKEKFRVTGIDLSGRSWADQNTLGLKHNWAHVAEIRLDRTPITDDSLVHLEPRSPKLRLLSLRGAKVTSASIKDFHAAVPGCRIEWDGGVIEAEPTPESPATN